MLKPGVLPLVLVVLLGSLAFAQTTHAPDRAARTTIMSIVVPPVAGAPFSATVNTEWTRLLEDGTTQVRKNSRLIARDGQGRVFQERRGLESPSGPGQFRLTRTEITDPSARTVALCDPSQRACELRVYRPAEWGMSPSQSSGANRNPALHSETLGTQTVDGLELIGTRETLTIGAAVMGTDRPLRVESEFWYSPKLRLNVTTRRSDPRSGTEIYSVTNVNQAEPDPNLFVLPSTARIVDHR
jgi:hypothetical protein